MFFLLPAYAVLLKLLYIRSRKYFVEHLVFALHLHSMLFILFTAVVLVPEQPQWDWLGNMLGVLFLTYYYVALKSFYQQRSVKTFIKFSLLLATHALLVAPAMLLVAAFTVGTL
jgi:hypothetical protein